MERTFLISTIILFITCTGLSQPKLSIDKPELNLGSIYGGENKKGKLTLKNIGNDTLRIFNINASCGCTTMKKPKGILLPGQSDVIEIEFRSAGYRGRVEKHININTNDPTSQYIAVSIIAEVKEILQPVQGSYVLWMDRIPVGKNATRNIELKNVSGYPVKVKGDSTSSPTVTAKIDKKTLKLNDTLNVDVTASPQKAGYSNQILYILTDHKIQPVVEIRVTYIGINEN
ncbi:MAG: DUF1573 domain-containing protein [Bacteroidetes bacterium]|nr:DUF1573 domain-containing protein [Bacteroidota bacterium]